MIGKVSEVKSNVVDARNNIKEIDSKMNQVDDKTAFAKLEVERIKSDQGNLYSSFYFI